MVQTLSPKPTQPMTGPVISSDPDAIEPMGILPVFSMVIWIVCLSVGLTGLLVPYPWPQPARQPPPIQTELLNVQIADDPAPAVSPALSALPHEPSFQADTASDVPPLPAIALPTPAIAFALPVEGPTQTVSAAQADFVRPATAKPVAGSPGNVQRLTYGQGEGAQPAPEYPREAANAGQQGTVEIRFVVDETGRVLSAEVIAASRWPLLNQAALRAVEDHWHFKSGARRAYEVSIDFELVQK